MCARTLGIPILPTYVGILSRQLEGRESEKPNGHQSGNMGEKTAARYRPTHGASAASSDANSRAVMIRVDL
jgi:hypothetical protein